MLDKQKATGTDKMLKRLIVIGWLLLSVAGVAAQELVNLYVAEIKILRPGAIDRVAVGDGSLLSTSLLKNGQLLVFAESAGLTTVHLWLKNGREQDLAVQIDERDFRDARLSGTLTQKLTEVQELLRDILGIDVHVVGERIVLSGRIDLSFEETIQTVIGVYPGVMDLTQKGQLHLPSEKMVLVNIKITEFNKNLLDQLGINWTTDFAGPSAAFASELINNQAQASGLSVLGNTNAPTPFGSLSATDASSAIGYFGIATEITSRINLAIDSGNAIILAEPRLVARSGGEANFLAGGEIPIEIVTPTSSSIEFKQFGIQLSITPEVDMYDNILATVETEISAVDRSTSVGNTPGFRTRRTSADISLRSGETLVLSGLVDREVSKDTTGLKFLSEIPVLGALFRSRDFRDARSELVIFVTPTVYDANSKQHVEAIARQKEMVREFIEAVDRSSLEILD